MKTLLSAIILMASICFATTSHAQCGPGEDAVTITNNTTCDFYYDIHTTTGNYTGTITPASSPVTLCIPSGSTAISMYVQPQGGGTDNTIDSPNPSKSGTDCASNSYLVHGLGWSAPPISLHIDTI